MRKILILFIVFVNFSLVLSEEILNRMIGPGVRHRKFYETNGPWAIDVLEVDLTNPYLIIETVKANDRVVGREKTSTMARRKDSNSHWVVCAINADFFAEDGTPTNCQIVNGTILKNPNKYSVLGFFEDFKPFIENVNLQGQLFSAHGINSTIHGVNRSRILDQLIIYNHFYGINTHTNIWGAEIRFQAIDEWTVNDTFRIKVIEIDSTQGNQNIPGNGGVLSGHGLSRDWLLKEVAVGDTLKLILELNPLHKRIKEMVGGIPRIIRNGKISIEEGYQGSGFATTRHPRTAVGFSKDSTKMFLFTVDGRQAGYSIGMSLYEEAEFLLGLGAYQAINLDGGGSTTMVIRNKIENRPSDPGGERHVSNALLIISTISVDSYSLQNTHLDTSFVHKNKTSIRRN